MNFFIKLTYIVHLTSKRYFVSVNNIYYNYGDFLTSTFLLKYKHRLIAASV